MKDVTPFLWFDANAEEAVAFYVSVFRDAEVLATTRYPEGGPRTPGTVCTIRFRLGPRELVALNGGPQFTFNEAISLVVNCESQEEVDHYWARLSEGGRTLECGWLKDRFGLAWQIVPSALWKWMEDPDPARQARVLTAVWTMTKLDLAALRRAYDGA